jgi:hypothetical protein
MIGSIHVALFSLIDILLGASPKKAVGTLQFVGSTSPQLAENSISRHMSHPGGLRLLNSRASVDSLHKLTRKHIKYNNVILQNWVVRQEILRLDVRTL